MQIHQFRPIASGAELQAERLAIALVKRGYAVNILTEKKEALSLFHEVLEGVSVDRVPFRMGYRPGGKIWKHFRYLVKKRNSFDIIHSHMCFNHAVVSAVFCKWFGKKSVLKIACAGLGGDLDVFSRFFGFTCVWPLIKKTDAVVAISSAVEQELLMYGFPRERIHRIPNGVDTLEFCRSRPLPDCAKFTFILIGRRTPQKGIDVAIKAVKRMTDSGIGKNAFELKLYGGEYPEHDYRALARWLQVDDIIRFLPFNDAIKDVYHNAHCLLLPSRAEGLSNVLLEAMAMEIPVIATQISGTVDVVEHNKNGILIPPEDDNALASAMIYILHNPEAARLLGMAARKRIVNNFSLDEVSRQYEILYNSLACHV